MISKFELIQMIWGIVCHDNYWIDLNAKMLSSGAILVEKSEQDCARKIAWLLTEIKSEMVKYEDLSYFDIPALVVGSSLPDELKGGRIAIKIEACREYAQGLSND